MPAQHEDSVQAAATASTSRSYAWLTCALSKCGIIIYVERGDGEVVWAENVPSQWCGGQIVGRRQSEFLPGNVSGLVDRLKQQAYESPDDAHAEIEIVDGQGSQWLAVWAEQTDEGHLAVTMIDISEQKQREQTLRALLREVSHRSKNLLAIILSIATQTSRYTQTVDHFLQRFRGRIQSLSSSQDLVTHSNWRGASLRDLLVEQVQRYRPDAASAVRLTGLNPYLSPNAALHVGLALHELTVNSVSFGALSFADGVVDVTVRPSDEEDGIDLLWSEKTGSGLETDRARRFGTVALERVVPAAVNGSSELHFSRDRFDYRLTLPASQYEASLASDG